MTSVHFAEPQWHFLFLGVLAFQSGLLIWLLVHLRHSAAPHQAALIEQQRRDLDTVRNTLHRVSTEHLEYRHETVQGTDRIWEELRRINARLDVMRCPLGDPKCPLNQQEG